jgi:hypothetical protein
MIGFPAHSVLLPVDLPHILLHSILATAAKIISTFIALNAWGIL